MHPVLIAFAYMHANGLIYNDFKPDNVMLADGDIKGHRPGWRLPPDPDGHDSTASDFCSDCGLQMPAPVQDDASQGTSGDVTSNAQPVSHESCPRCKTDRDDPSTPVLRRVWLQLRDQAGW